jgi:flagellar protein FliO/FliZ
MRILSSFVTAGLPALTVTGSAYAAEPSPSVTLDLFKVLGGLVVVLIVMAGSAWLLKRVGIAKVAGNQTIKVIGGVSVGGRERVIVLEVGDQWVVVGVAPGRVNAITTLPRQNHATPVADSVAASTNFAAWLKQTLDKRNAN